MVNGRLKSKFSKARCIALAFIIAFIILAAFLLYIGITEGESLEDILMPIFIGGIFIYMLMKTPMAIRDVQVFIDNEGNITLLHKDKDVIVDLIKDEDGKYEFVDSEKKNECVRYADGSEMSSKIKDRIICYLVDVLQTNAMLTNDPFKPNKNSDGDIKTSPQSETLTKEEQKRRNDTAKRNSKIWAVSCIVCIAITYFSFQSAVEKEQEIIENYDFSNIEEYKGIVTDITTSSSRVNGHSKTSFYEEILLENGETISLGPSGEGRHYMVGKEVIVYTNQRHTSWSYSKEGVISKENNTFFNYIPCFIFGTGVAFCLVQLVESLKDSRRAK